MVRGRGCHVPLRAGVCVRTARVCACAAVAVHDACGPVTTCVPRQPAACERRRGADGRARLRWAAFCGALWPRACLRGVSVRPSPCRVPAPARYRATHPLACPRRGALHVPVDRGRLTICGCALASPCVRSCAAAGGSATCAPAAARSSSNAAAGSFARLHLKPQQARRWLGPRMAVDVDVKDLPGSQKKLTIKVIDLCMATET